MNQQQGLLCYLAFTTTLAILKAIFFHNEDEYGPRWAEVIVFAYLMPFIVLFVAMFLGLWFIGFVEFFQWLRAGF